MQLGHIRLWAQTDITSSAVLALEYARALVRYAPVRLITVSGLLEGPWRAMARLLETPQVMPYINVVCADQEHWTRTITVGMPEQDGMRTAIATGKTPQKVKSEAMERELYTVGIRNVLIALALPTLPRYAIAANKYEHVIVPTQELADQWGKAMPQGSLWRTPTVIPSPVPIEKLREFRAAVTAEVA